ncbi:enoyl-CoA hydratase/isomerase family protein [Phenylobacterium sp.]|uniref:enoyl-CoA hydratase/isomerase family protein n=1 Tax=Phenylobacterium sp. TaxID=1871053 RepID=UPI00301E4F0D
MIPVEDHTFEHIAVRRAGRVIEVALARPAARNALQAVTIRELTEVARGLRLRSGIAAVVLTGGPDIFSAGADVADFENRIRAPTLLETREVVMAGPDLCRAWEEIEAVTIVAVEGYCVGGACALALACDFRILGAGAFLRLPEVALGVNMSWRTVPRVTALVGPARAKRFVIFGDRTDAATCLDWGLADEVVDDGQALSTAHAWADRIAGLPPLPVRMTKEQVNATAHALSAATSYMDRDQYLVTSRTRDFAEGRDAFLRRRTPEFRGD